MSNGTSPTSADEAMQMLDSAMGYLIAADPAQLGAAAQARCLKGLERHAARGTAVRAAILSAFSSGQGYTGDACHSARSWLIHQTRITPAAAVAHTAWARRAAAHPQVMLALAEGWILSESYARHICTWTEKLPGNCRDAADTILVAAAKAGADLRDLAELAAEILARSQPQEPDRDQAFEDRSVKLAATFDGAGVLHGDLTPECAAVVTAVLDALSAPAGADDDRSHAQRYHDGLHEAMQRLITAGLLPERAGQPVKVMAHVSLADLMVLQGSSALLEQWTASARAAWAAHRAGDSAGGGDGAAWLDGDAAAAMACDASVIPVVFGNVNPAALEDLLRLCVELDRLRHTAGHDQADPDDDPAAPGPSPAWEALEQAIISKAVDLLSGPDGLASFLRRRQLGVRLGGPSLPLDIGVSENVPAGLRNAILLRDRYCRWPGGCRQPAAACQVHHVRHKKHGGQTSLDNCLLLCFFHHQIMIHKLGWTLVLNPDGTTMAWNKDKTKVLRSHSPPTRTG